MRSPPPAEDLAAPRFPRASRYDPAFLMREPFGAHPLWMTEWLCEELDLEPGMRVLDLGCGHAKSSIFLAKEFDLEVWATDLWIAAEHNRETVREHALTERIHCVDADARALDFEHAFFDAILSIDAYPYFGTDDLCLPYLGQFLRPRGQIGFAGAGLMRELAHPIPMPTRLVWGPDMWCLHTADWWRTHWTRTGLVDLRVADTLENGIDYWKRWSRANGCDSDFLEVLDQDAGNTLGYVRVSARMRPHPPRHEYDLRTGKSY